MDSRLSTNASLGASRRRDRRRRRAPAGLYTPFYGGRQFSIEDINRLTLIFWQPQDLVAPPEPAP